MNNCRLRGSFLYGHPPVERAPGWGARKRYYITNNYFDEMIDKFV